MSELFLPETEADVEKIASIARIHVRRAEGGKHVYSPTSFSPEDLTSIGQVHEMFGGGDYIVEGRSANGIFVKNCRFQLPGPSKPLSLVEQQAKEESAAAAAAAAQKPAPAPAGSDVMAIMLQMMMAQMQQTTQIFTAMLTRGDSASENLLERSRQLEDSARREHTEFMRALMERANNATAAAGASGGSQESFMQGVEFMQGMVSEMMQRQQSDGEGDILGTITEFVNGFGAQARTAAQNGPPAVTPPGVQNGAPAGANVQ